MARMTGGEALVKSLSREGVRVIFGLPSVQIYGTLAALRDELGGLSTAYAASSPVGFPVYGDAVTAVINAVDDSLSDLHIVTAD